MVHLWFSTMQFHTLSFRITELCVCIRYLMPIYYLRISNVTTIARRCCQQSQTFIIYSFVCLAEVFLVMANLQLISVDGEYLLSQKTAARLVFFLCYTQQCLIHNSGLYMWLIQYICFIYKRIIRTVFTRKSMFK